MTKLSDRKYGMNQRLFAQASARLGYPRDFHSDLMERLHIALFWWGKR